MDSVHRRRLRTVFDGLRYAFYILGHPFDGFWCAQREKRGNAASASVIVGLLVAVTIFSRRVTGYIFNYNRPGDSNFFSEIVGIVAPLLLWCVVNWSVTTLMDGEGTFRDIYIATAYAMTPLVLLTFVQTLLSRVITLEAQGIYTLLSGIALLWTGFLLFTGMMTIQQYSIKKTVLTVIIDIVGMLAILFFFLLFFALIQQAVNFAYVLYTEFTLRVR